MHVEGVIAAHHVHQVIAVVSTLQHALHSHPSMLRFTTSNSWDTTLPSAGVLLLATALLYSYNSASAVEPLNSSLLPITHSHYTHFIATYRFIARSMRASNTPLSTYVRYSMFTSSGVTDRNVWLTDGAMAVSLLHTLLLKVQLLCGGVLGVGERVQQVHQMAATPNLPPMASPAQQRARVGVL